MANLGQLTLDLVAKIGGFTGPLDQASRQAKRTADDISRSMARMKGIFAEIFPAAAGVASVAGLTYFVKSTIDAIDKLDDLSKATGVSVETLSTMGYAAKFSGIDLDTLATGFKKLSKNMSDSAAGTGEAKEAFKLLGITVTNSDGTLKSSEQVMLHLADAFAGMEDGAGKTALAMKFFGKSGADMVPMLNEGGAGLAKLQQEARDAGVAISTEAAKAAAEFNDNLDRLVANIKGAVIPGLNTLVKTANDFAFVMEAVFGKDDWDKLAAAEKTLEQLRKNAAAPSPYARPEQKKAYSDWLQAQIKEKEADISQLRERLTHKTGGPPSGAKKDAPIIPDEAEAKRQKEALDKQLASIKELTETYGLTEKEITLYKLTLMGATEAQLKAAAADLTALEAKKKSAKDFEDSQKFVNDQVAEGKRLYEELRTPMEEYEARLVDLQGLLENGAISMETYRRAADQAFNKLAAGGKAVYEATRTPLEALQEELKELFKLYEQGAISAETFERASAKAEEEFGEKIKKTTEKGKDQFADLKQAIEGWGRSSADAVAEFAMSGKASFSDLANSIISDMLKMAAYKAIFEPMFKGISTAIFPSTPGATPTPSAHGNAFDHGNVIPFAKGGVISQPMTFPLGLAGEAGPEAILPLKRIGGDLGVKADLSGARSGGGAWKIEIINKGEPAKITDAKLDFQNAVITVWLDGYQRNKGGLRTSMGG